MPILAVLAILFWLVDRVLLWCELRGWITYRRMPRVRRGYGMSVMNIEALLQPDKRHVIELQQEGEVSREEDDEAQKRTPAASRRAGTARPPQHRGNSH